MPGVKPEIATDWARALAERELGVPVEEMRELEGGEIARTFALTAGGEAYVLRVNWHMGANFEKETYIARLAAPAGIPMAPLMTVGRAGELHFSITRRVEGERADRLPEEEQEALVPALLGTLGAIHGVDVSGTTGYGTFGDDGAGLFPNWRASLAQIREEEPDWDFYGKWHTLFETTFLERDLFDALYARMLGLLDACPEERWLVHGNYGFGNVLVHEGRIAAVLDWIDAKYGDFVFDLAWLDFWAPHHDYPRRYLRGQAVGSPEIPRFAERLRCYKLYIGLDALRFFAKAGREDAYRFARERALAAAGA